MSRLGRYAIPGDTHRVETTILRSRFVTTIGHAPTVDEARAFIARVSDEFPEATHNCWAFVVGPPGDTSHVGMSDAGEPHGTAGKPMLAVLLGSGLGDIVAVVTRYYGGTKLGRGGLARAYSGGVKAVLEDLPRAERVSKTRLRVGLGYEAVDPVRRILDDHEAQVSDENYGAGVTLTIDLPDERVDAFVEQVAGITKGTATVEREGAR